MKARSVRAFHEPSVRGPHLRYFFTAVSLAFVLAAILVTAFILFIGSFLPF